MPTPPKPFKVLKSEGKSHRTKKELKIREQGEKSLSTGTALKERQEVKKNKIAHKEFKRINELLSTIEKNDAIYEAVINRYCLIQAECSIYEERKEELYALVGELKKTFEECAKDMEQEEKMKYFLEFTDNMATLSATMINIDKQLQTKRKMLLDIEKENIMTIAAALRCIPKNETNETNKEKLLKAINGS